MAIVLPAVLVVITSIVVIYLVKTILKFRENQKHLVELCKDIPGSPRHWFFGNTHQIETFDAFMRKMQEEYVEKSGVKMYVFWLFRMPVFVICHPDTAKIILRSSEPKLNLPNSPGYHFVEPWLGQSLLISNGQKWERTRRLLTPAFHFDVLGPYFRIYNQVADIFLDNMAVLSENGSVEVFKAAGLVALDTLLRCSFSYDGDIQKIGESHPYVTTVKKLVELILRRTMFIFLWPDYLYRISPPGREFKQHCNYVHGFSTKIIQQRRKLLEENPDMTKKRYLDFLDILITAKDQNGKCMKDEEIRNEVDTFMFAGHDTTSSVLSWSLYSLSQQEEIQDKVFNEIRTVLGTRKYIEQEDLGKFKYINCFVREVLRYYTPVPVITRCLTEPCVLDGFTIPTGSHIDINLFHIHHHPDVWADPWKFSPERFLDTSENDPFSFCPFSAGPRNCIGQHFALDEIKVMIARTVSRFKLLPAEDHSPIPFMEVVLRSKNGIHINFSER